MICNFLKSGSFLLFSATVAISSYYTSCATYPAPGEPVDEIPYACSQAFARELEEPLQVTSAPVQQVAFSSDCRKMLSIDTALQTLRLTDLEKRHTLELTENTYLARFTPDGQKVLIITTENEVYYLSVFDGESLEPIATDVSTTLVTSPDGSRIAYLKNYDQEKWVSDLLIARLDESPPVDEMLDNNVVGSPAFTPDGKRIVYMADPVDHSQQEGDLEYNWRTASLYSASLRDGSVSVVASDVLAWSFSVSGDDVHVYAATDYDYSTQARSLVRYSLTGEPAIELIADLPAYLGPGELVEVLHHGIILHPMVFFGEQFEDYRSELWSTKVDGRGSSVAASGVMSAMQTCMYFIPFQVIPGDRVLFFRRESRDLDAFDLNSKDTWTVVETLESLSYSVSPDGKSVLSLREPSPGQAADLLLTPVDGSQHRLMASDLPYGTRFEFNAASERILLLPGSVAENQARSLFCITPADDQVTVLADDVPGALAYGSDFTLHPGGWLVAVQRLEGLTVMPVP